MMDLARASSDFNGATTISALAWLRGRNVMEEGQGELSPAVSFCMIKQTSSGDRFFRDICS